MPLSEHDEALQLVRVLRDTDRRLQDLEVMEFFDPLSGARYTIVAILATISDGDRAVIRWMPGTHIRGNIQSWSLIDDGGVSGNITVKARRSTYGVWGSGSPSTLGSMSISSNVKGYSDDLSSWSTPIIKHGDILLFEVAGTPTVSGPVTVALEVLLESS